MTHKMYSELCSIYKSLVVDICASHVGRGRNVFDADILMGENVYG